MDSHLFFLQLMTVLLCARMCAELAARLRVAPVIGELLAGVLLGPSLLGWVDAGDLIGMLAQIGIILLLFQVGLETDVRKLTHTGRHSLLVAMGGFVTPFLLGYGICTWYFGLSQLTSLFVGGTLTATSIGITVRVLRDLGRQQQREGQIVLGAAVLDDILGVMLLALLYEFSTNGGVNVGNSLKVLLFVTLFFLLAPPAAKLMAFIIKRFEPMSEIPGIVPTAIVVLVLLFSWVAHRVGAPELLGGFAAGLALSRRFFLPFGAALGQDYDFSRHIERQVRPLVQLFTPVFFVYVGLTLNLREIDWGSSFIWKFAAVVLVVAIASKFAGALLLAERPGVRLLIGVAMTPRGEVGLIFAELGRVSGIFDNEIYAGLVIVIALTTLLPPFVLRWMLRRQPMTSGRSPTFTPGSPGGPPGAPR